MSRLKGEVYNTSYPFVDYSYSQSVSGNYTDIDFTFGMHFGADSNFRTDHRTLDWDSPVGSGSYSYGPTGTGPWPEGSTNSEVVYRSGSFRLTHDSSGAGKASIAFSVFKDYGGSNTLSYSGTITLPTIARQPGAPGKPTVTGHADSDPTTVSFAWTAPSNVGSGLVDRQLQVSTSSTFSSTVINTTASWDTSHNSTGLAKATTYYVRVRASSAAGFGPWSSTLTFTTGTTIPGTPDAPTINSYDYTSVSLVWDEPADTGGSPIASYSVQASTSSGFTSGVMTSTASSTSTTVTGLAASTTYFFRVAATNADSTSAYSDAVLQATLAAAAPAAPAAPTFSGVGGTSLTVNWTAPSGNGSAITGYTVQYSTSATFTVHATIGGLSSAARSASVTGLAPGTLYYFRVLATNALGTTTGANASTTTGTTTPSAPAAPTVDNIGQLTATVSYTAPATGGMPITGYDIQRATDDAFSTNVVTTTDTASPLDITGLLPGVSYWVRVRAKNANGTGPWSDAGSFTAAPSVWLRTADNSSWLGGQVYIPIGTTWVLCTTQTWNGSTWV